jgi:hypothetical protein
MKINKEQIDKVLFAVKKQWKAVALGTLILLSLIITLLLPGDKKESDKGMSRNADNSASSTPVPAKKSSNPLTFLFGGEEAESEITPTAPPLFVPENTINSSTSTTTITRVNSDGTTTTQTVGGTNSIKTSQGTINPNTNIENDISGNENQDSIALVFQNSDGTRTTYIPTGTPPDEIRWARYINDVGKYEINYPFNWQFVYSVDENGHEGIALYPPGVNKNDPNSPYVGFGITEIFLLPAAGDTSNALITPVRVDGVSGDLYTNGPLGNSYIASVFSYDGNYFGLGGSKSDTTFAYVYYFMIQSLTFTN